MLQWALDIVDTKIQEMWDTWPSRHNKRPWLWPPGLQISLGVHAHLISVTLSDIVGRTRWRHLWNSFVMSQSRCIRLQIEVLLSIVKCCATSSCCFSSSIGLRIVMASQVNYFWNDRELSAWPSTTSLEGVDVMGRISQVLGLNLGDG